MTTANVVLSPRGASQRRWRNFPSRMYAVKSYFKKCTSDFLMAFIIFCVLLNCVMPYEEELEAFKAMIPKNYSRTQAPEAREIYCSIFPQFITKLSMKDMDFDVDLIVIIEWKDERLQLPNGSESRLMGSRLPRGIDEQIWHPLLYFINCKGRENDVINPNNKGAAGDIVFDRPWFHKPPNESVFRVYFRQTFRFTCNQRFETYPFDVQQCHIILTMRCLRRKPQKIILRSTTKNAISVPPGFSLKSYYTDECKNISEGTLVYVCRKLTFKFQRVYAQHLMLNFVPSILIVMLSWVSFWLDVETAAPRIALGLTTLLTLATQFSAAQRELPSFAEIKALDVWMFTCIFIVFASLFEFAIANLHSRMRLQNIQTMQKAYIPKRFLTAKIEKRIIPVVTRTTRRWQRWKMALQRGNKTSPIDYGARIFFPLAFLLFNIVFWTYYLLAH